MFYLSFKTSKVFKFIKPSCVVSFKEIIIFINPFTLKL
jgi:hypothetical protein